MKSLQHGSLQFNNNLSYDFGGDNLSSDSGLLLVRAFAEKIGLRSMLEAHFVDPQKRKTHSSASVIEQVLYQAIAGYHRDHAANALRHDPIFTTILDKEALASQPTISRVINSFRSRDIKALNSMMESLYLMLNNPEEKEHIVLDLDSTIVQAYGFDVIIP
jgi:hypothetical protein